MGSSERSLESSRTVVAPCNLVREEQNALSLLHVGSRNTNRRKNQPYVDGDVDGAELHEEEMQRAIEASLKDRQGSHDLEHNDVDDHGAGAGCNEKATLRAPPVVASGMGGCAWVDNSEFFGPRASQFVKTHDPAPSRFSRSRSVPCVASVGSINPGGGHTKGSRSGSSRTLGRVSENRPEMGKDFHVRIRYQQRSGELIANPTDKNFNEHFHSCHDSRAEGAPIW